MINSAVILLCFLACANAFDWSSKEKDWEEYWTTYSDTGAKIICSPDTCPCEPKQDAYHCPQNQTTKPQIQSQFIWFYGAINGGTNYLKWNHPMNFNRNVYGYINMTFQVDSWTDPTQNATLNLYFQSNLLQTWNSSIPYGTPTTVSIPIPTTFVSTFSLAFIYTTDTSPKLHTTQFYIYDFFISLAP